MRESLHTRRMSDPLGGAFRDSLPTACPCTEYLLLARGGLLFSTHYLLPTTGYLLMTTFYYDLQAYSAHIYTTTY